MKHCKVCQVASGGKTESFSLLEGKDSFGLFPRVCSSWLHLSQMLVPDYLWLGTKCRGRLRVESIWLWYQNSPMLRRALGWGAPGLCLLRPGWRRTLLNHQGETRGGWGNWEGKEGPRKVGGIAAGKEKKGNRIKIFLVPVPHLELCRHVVSCFRLCGPVVKRLFLYWLSCVLAYKSTCILSGFFRLCSSSYYFENVVSCFYLFLK